MKTFILCIVVLCLQLARAQYWSPQIPSHLLENKIRGIGNDVDGSGNRVRGNWNLGDGKGNVLRRSHWNQWTGNNN